MELSQAIEAAKAHPLGVLVTQKHDGRPQLSNITHSVGDDGVIRISVTDGRAKTRNLRRDPRASLYVGRPDGWAYAVLEGTTTLSAVATSPHDEAVDELVALYRAVRGEHPDWDEYRAVMIKDGRLVVRFTPDRAYGMWSAS
ncbi:MAG TPA: PPOX class F420-dependent oxidoreductase [Acidimicrobiales bacterium]|nr:PPOX class F420-dependent oxidoreductase [Acidimicrobiales bacterium]